MRRTLLAPLLLGALACASAPLPVAEQPIDWEAVAAEGTPSIVTRDRSGGEKVRPLWLVVVDGRGYIRTSQTSWLADIQRNANVLLRVGGLAYPLRAVPVADRSRRAAVNDGFRSKYGFFDFLIHPFKAPAANILVLVER